MAYLSTKEKGEGKLPRLSVDEERRYQRRCEAKEYECKRARHDADEWQKVALDLGKERIGFMKKIGDLKRHRIYERIGWLLLCTSLALVQHL